MMILGFKNINVTLTWRQKGVQYAVGIKAGDRTSLVKMANSAINP
jgi:hypothetical protein